MSRAFDLLLLVGPSGSGKTTLIKRLMKEFPACFGYSVSHTTRNMRPGETDGVSYHFVAQEKFGELIKEGKFLEHATVHNTSYGTSEMSVETVLDRNQLCCMDIDIKGAQRLRMSKFRSFIVFIRPPTFEILEARLRGRGSETEERIVTRLTNAKKELKWFDNNSAFFDGSVVNDDLDSCYERFSQLVLRSAFPDGIPAAPTHSR